MNTADSKMLDHPGMVPATADEWAARMHGTAVSDTDHIAFQMWLKSDPGNPAAYEECASLWTITEQMRARPSLLREARARMAQSSVTSPIRKGHRVRWAMAASVAIIAIAIGASLQKFSWDGTQTATRKGEQRTIVLHDGSTIQLNTNTLVSYSINEKERRVELRRGEAYFDVAKDPARPFIVRAGKSEVRVVGTQFTVRQDGDRLEVTVREGKVNVLPDVAALTTGKRQHVELTPGESMRLDAEEERIKVAMVDTNRAMAWRTGSLDFDDSTLEQVIAEINRYVEKPFVIEDDSIRLIPVTGKVRVNDLESIRYMLRETFNIESLPRDDVVALRAAKH